MTLDLFFAEDVNIVLRIEVNWAIPGSSWKIIIIAPKARNRESSQPVPFTDVPPAACAYVVANNNAAASLIIDFMTASYI